MCQGNNGWTTEEWQALFEERAAIAEHDDGQSRAAAKAMAFEWCVIEWLMQNSSPSNPNVCAACVEPDKQGHSVLPFGTDNHGHTWLHPECWDSWNDGRRAKAIADLATLGIENPAEKLLKDIREDKAGDISELKLAPNLEN